MVYLTTSACSFSLVHPFSVTHTLITHSVFNYLGDPIRANRICLNIDHGDVYIFSEKATGQDWKKKTIPTLRHAAGAQKFLTVKSAKKAGTKK